MTSSGLSRGGQRIFVVLWLALSTWLITDMVRSRYPAAYLVEWQVRLLDGSYYPKFTILLLLLVAAIAAAIAGGLHDFLLKKGPFRRQSRP